MNHSLEARLLKRRKITESGCWEWTGALTSGGYGNIKVAGKVVTVTRLSLRVFKPEEFADFLDVLHKCNNRKCYNPDHLYCGSKKDNARDAINAGKSFASNCGKVIRRTK
jgi:hypothetical protein